MSMSTTSIISMCIQLRRLKALQGRVTLIGTVTNR